MKQEMCYI